MFKLDYVKVEKGGSCFTGVEEHGPRCIFYLDTEYWDLLGNLFDSYYNKYYTLNVFADGTINIMDIKRNERLEEWFENVVTDDIQNDRLVVKAINEMLATSPVARDEPALLINSLSELVNALKNNII